MLFRRCSTESTGGNGFTSASEGVIFSCTPSPAVAPLDNGNAGPSPEPFPSFGLMVVPRTASLRTAGTRAPDSTLDLHLLKGPGPAATVLPRCARARRYVRLRSQRNVSRKKNANRAKSMPRSVASIHNGARQLNACASVPPRRGPSEVPSGCAAKKMPIIFPRSAGS